MTYGEYHAKHPEHIDITRTSYSEYLLAKFESITNYLRREIPDFQSRCDFEGKVSFLLDDIAQNMETFIDTIEKR